MQDKKKKLGSFPHGFEGNKLTRLESHNTPQSGGDTQEQSVASMAVHTARRTDAIMNTKTFMVNTIVIIGAVVTLSWIAALLIITFGGAWLVINSLLKIAMSSG